ncbi:hypothetical protein HDV00_009351, partial [Rhizophlyctis rosea]
IDRNHIHGADHVETFQEWVQGGFPIDIHPSLRHTLFKNTRVTDRRVIAEVLRQERPNVNSNQLSFYIMLLATSEKDIEGRLKNQFRDQRAQLVKLYNIHPATILAFLSEPHRVKHVDDEIAQSLCDHFDCNQDDDVDAYGRSVPKLIDAFKSNKHDVGVKILKAWVSGRLE